MSDDQTNVYQVDDVWLWLEQDSSVHIKATSQANDPVELSAAQARRLATILTDLADMADK